MDLRTLVLVVYVLQIAFICDGNQENHTIPDHHDQNGYTTYDEQEKKLIGVLEEALLQLKERKLQIDTTLKNRKVPVENITEFLANRTDDYHPAHHPIAAIQMLRQCVVYKLDNLEKFKTYRDKMTNLTNTMASLIYENAVDSRDKEKEKRALIWAMKEHNVTITSLAEEYLSSYLFNIDNTTLLSTKEPNNEKDKLQKGAQNDSNLDLLTPKDLIDLALSAFGMEYRSHAFRLLSEAVLKLSKNQNGIQ